MHVTSLPGPYGIGTFGKEALHFAELLKESQCKYWQVLPFAPTDSVNSPYRSDSAFAGNPMLIDLEDLRDRGLITDDELQRCVLGDDWNVDFDQVIPTKKWILDLAFERVDEKLDAEIADFVKKSSWLEEYALFKALTDKFDAQWYDWPEDYKNRKPSVIKAAKEALAPQMRYYEFIQYIFAEQWKACKEQINALGIKIIGDMPIYVSLESVDVWTHQDLFQLKDGQPTAVAGVPPDFFSEDGQLWGNPLYNWKKMKEEHYEWWMERIGHNLEIYDVLRIDHFRAFASYYSIEADAETARHGTWLPGPGKEFFDVLDEHFEDAPLIAEDLGGDEDEDVQKLLRETGLPGMRVIEMAFVTYGPNVHLPYQYINNSVAYIGTHDNNTLLGWLEQDVTPEQRQYALAYADFNHEDDNWHAGGPNSPVCHAFMRMLWQTGAGIVMIQLQDALGFGAENRMNIPGTSSGNWRFRVPRHVLDEMNTDWIKFFNMTYQRGMA